MLEDEHRSSMGRSHYIIFDKCYVSIMLQKVLRSKRKNEKKKYDEKKRKVRKKGRRKKKEKGRK
jgi:hypothetical protein